MKPESSSFQKVVAVTGRNVDGYPSTQTPAWSRLARTFPRSAQSNVWAAWWVPIYS